MKLSIVHETLNGIKVIKPEVFEDERGFFMETYRTDQFKQLGISDVFVQDNHSRSAKGVLRGLHFQWQPPMAKLMRVISGTAFLVAVDIRVNSPTLGHWYGAEISEQNKLMVYAPAGFARGFCVLSEWAEIQYKCSGIYNSSAEAGISWCDKEIGINWPIQDPILSVKDSNAPSLSEWLKTEHANKFIYE